MAWIRGYEQSADITGLATSIAVGTMPAHETDDLIIAIYGKDSTGGLWTTPSGYTAISNSQAQNVSTSSYYKVATSSSESIPAGVHPDADEMHAIVIIVADVDTTTPVDTVSAVQTFASATSHTWAAVSTTSNNTLNIFYHLTDIGTRYPTQPPGLMTLAHPPLLNFDASTSWTHQYTAGNTITPQFKMAASVQGHIIGIQVNSNVSDVIPAHSDYSSPPTDIINPLRGVGTSGFFGGGSVDPSADFPSAQIGPGAPTTGQPFVYDATSADNNEGVDAIAQAIDARSTGSVLSLFGSVWDLTVANEDLSSNPVCVHISSISGTRFRSVDSVENGGYIFGVRTDNGVGGNIYRFWNVGAVDSSPSPFDRYAVIVDLTDTTYQWGSDIGSGTVDLTNVSGIFIGVNRGNAAQHPIALWAEWHSLNTNIIKGGDSSVPAKFQTFVDSLAASRVKTIINQGKASSKQFLSFQSLQIGGGSDDVYFADPNSSLEFAKTTTGKNLQFNAAPGSLGITLYGLTGDTIDLSNTVISGEDAWFYTVHASSSLIGASPGTWGVSAHTVIGATVSLQDVYDAGSGMSFIDCTFTGNSADLSGGCTFDGTAITVTSEADYANYANCTLKNSAAAITITGDQSHTGTGWTDALLTVSANTYDITYTGTTNFSIQSAATLSVNNTSSGTCTIVTPTFDLTVDVNQTGCQIHVYTTNTQTTLDTEASAAQLVYTHSSETVDITVLKDGYIPYRQTGLALSGNVGVDVQLAASREYDSSHGLTYTTDAAIYANYNIITGITQDNPAVVTYSGADNFSNSDIITLHDVVGMTEVNGNRYTVANVNTGANTFELSGINSSAFTAYTSAGIVVSGLSVPTFGPSAVGVFSLIMEQHRTNSALYNLPFNLQMDGAGALYLTNGVEGIADADIERMTAAGVGYLDVDSTQTATWVGIESVGTIPGTNTGEWTADDAATVTDARASGVFDEIIKIHGDADHDNFDNRANRIVMKMNVNGYREERVDVRALYGISGNFKPAHYVVPIAPAAIQAATGDPALTTDPVITDHATSVQSWNGKNFLITITDGSTPNTGEDILRHLNYFLRSANDTTLDGNDPFAWPEMVSEVVAGTSYETIYGYTEDAQTSTLKGVRVVKNDGTTAHPDFTRFQSNDGTYYTAPITANISITNMPTAGADIRLQLENTTALSASAWAATTAYSLGDQIKRSTGFGTERVGGLYYVCTTAGTSNDTEPTWGTVKDGTTADTNGSGAGDVVWTCYDILFYNADPGASSIAANYVDGEEFSSGDTYTYRFAEADGTTSYKQDGGSGVTTSSGLSVLVSVTENSTYATLGVDGSAVTGHTADFANDEVDLTASANFAGENTQSWLLYILTTSEGMFDFWGGFTIGDGYIQFHNAVLSAYMDNTSATNIRETSNIKIFRDDGAYPVKGGGATSGGGGIDLRYRDPVYTISTGSVLSSSEKTELTNSSTIATLVKAAVITNAAGADVAADIIAVKAETALIVADTNELQTDWVDGGRLDSILDATATQASVDSIDGNVDAILVDTGTTLPAQISGVDTKMDTVDANIDGVKAKTDQLAFTKANEVDSNIQSVNDVTVTGVGSDADPWGSD